MKIDLSLASERRRKKVRTFSANSFRSSPVNWSACSNNEKRRILTLTNEIISLSINKHFRVNLQREWVNSWRTFESTHLFEDIFHAESIGLYNNQRHAFVHISKWSVRCFDQGSNVTILRCLLDCCHSSFERRRRRRDEANEEAGKDSMFRFSNRHAKKEKKKNRNRREASQVRWWLFLVCVFSSMMEERDENTHKHTTDKTYHGGYWSSAKNRVVRSVLVVLPNDDQHHYYRRNLT